MLLALQSWSSHWDTWYWCFGFARKAFHSIILLIINVHSWNEKTWIPIIISILFVMGTIIMIVSLGYTILMLWICKKSFLSIILLIINVHSWNEKTWIPIIITILFVMGTIIMFFMLGYTILMLWICRKSFSFHHFTYN